MTELLSISKISCEISGTIDLPGSKSESNRALIINALSGRKAKINNLSSSSDTNILIKALEYDENIIDVADAGTTMRFLIAYFAFTKQNKIITGNERMLQRPIGHLVDALISLGASIEYTGIAGFPPVKINGDSAELKGRKVKMPANVSSQFISALLMIAPLLPSGLEIDLEGKISSKPYIEMTLGIMSCFGIKSKWHNNIIIVEKQNYVPAEYTVESDWSNAAFWYSMVALSEDSSVFLKGLKRNSFQGDSIIQEWFRGFGVITEFSDIGAFISKCSENIVQLPAIIDFSANPDLAQAIIVLSAAKGLSFKFEGLESLRIKETDRIKALQNELKKFNILFEETTPGEFSIKGIFDIDAKPCIETYNDHRMAMAFAPLALRCSEIIINDPDCVKKSYPGFWEDLKNAGFDIK